MDPYYQITVLYIFSYFSLSVLSNFRKKGLEERRRKQLDLGLLLLWTFSTVSYKKEEHNISMAQLLRVALSVRSESAGVSPLYHLRMETDSLRETLCYYLEYQVMEKCGFLAILSAIFHHQRLLEKKSMSQIPSTDFCLSVLPSNRIKSLEFMT